MLYIIVKIAIVLATYYIEFIAWNTSDFPTYLIHA